MLHVALLCALVILTTGGGSIGWIEERIQLDSGLQRRVAGWKALQANQ